MQPLPLALISLLAALPVLASRGENPGFSLQGQITTDKSAKPIQLILEDPKSRNKEIARTDAGEDGTYEFHGLIARDYRLTAYVDGKRQDRRNIQIVCRTGS